MAETKISKAQAGSGIWTSDSLVAGTNISITQVPQPVIDENTLGVWHFDNNLNNAVSGSSYTVSSSTIVASNSQYKFGNYSLCSSSGSTGNITLIDQALPSGDFTVDYWLRTGNSSPSLTIGLNKSSDLNYGPTRQGLYINQNSTFIGFNTTSSGGTQGGTSYGTTIETASWHHIAMVRESNTVKYYLDGVLQSSKAASSTYYLQANFNYQAQGINYVQQFIDELRLSNIARWTSDFTPYTEPYAASAGPAQYAINNTKADPDLSSYLKNTATGSNSLTINGNASSYIDSTNIGNGSSVGGNNAIAIGNASATTSATSIAIGRYASSAKCSVAIGGGDDSNSNTRASGQYSVAVGSTTWASSSYCTSVGYGASSRATQNTAVGFAAEAYTGTQATAIGYNAKSTANKAIQLGSGTNSTANTFKVFNTTVVNASGKIPAANLDTAIPTVDQTYDATSTNAQSGTAVASAVSTKADTDLSNVNNTGKSTAIGWGMPDYSAGITLSNTANFENVITKKGYVLFNAEYTLGNDMAYIKYDNNSQAFQVAACHNYSSSYYDGSHNIVPVDVGNIVYNTDGKILMTFFPCKGAN